MNGDRFNDRDGGRDRRDRPRDREHDRRDRRRSRSPREREGGRRREEGDSYSSSRFDRNREREDRYRRDDRGWNSHRDDRDRGDRRRHERDDRRGGGRDRDLFDGDRRGGRGDRGDRGGGGDRPGRGEDRRDRDEFAAQARGKAKSPSPPPRKREPTPDLTNVVSVLTRKRRLTQWDIKPPGYENVTAEQAKLSGMFPLPGAPRQQVMDPSRLQSLMNASGGGAEKAALKPSSSRQAKRLVVSNLPASAAEDSIVGFFNLQMNGLNVVESNDPCVSCQFSSDRGYAMVEFKNPSEATLALAFDGTGMDSTAPETGLVIRRPKDYIVSTISDEEQQPGIDQVSTTVPDTANKVSITNILSNLNEEQVLELVKAFGPVRSFVLVRERGNDQESRGIAFFEFVDPATTEPAIEALNGMDVGPQRLRCQKASIGYAQTNTMEMSVSAMSLLAGTTAENLEEGRVLQLLNMVTPEELIDQLDYEEIVEDVQEECAKFGQVVDIKVPRPSMGSRQSAGVGKIFVKYDTPEHAKKAMGALAGRKFADRTVVVTHYSEENFDTNTF